MPPVSLVVGRRRLIDLSALVHNLNVVTVGVEYPSCIIVRMILELRRRCSFLPSGHRNCSIKEGIHFRMAFGDKTEVDGIRIGPPLFEPEEEASINSKAFEIWVTILAFIAQKICGPERLKSPCGVGAWIGCLAAGLGDRQCDGQSWPASFPPHRAQRNRGSRTVTWPKSVATAWSR
jgi:hypothetical protein